MRETQPVTLATLYGGAAIEAVDHELQNAMNNIVDVNTKAEAARMVTLKLTIKPNKERNIASITFYADSKLAPAEALETSVLIDRDISGKTAAFEMTRTNEHGQEVIPFFKGAMND